MLVFGGVYADSYMFPLSFLSLHDQNHRKTRGPSLKIRKQRLSGCFYCVSLSSLSCINTMKEGLDLYYTKHIKTRIILICTIYQPIRITITFYFVTNPSLSRLEHSLPKLKLRRSGIMMAMWSSSQRTSVQWSCDLLWGNGWRNEEGREIMGNCFFHRREAETTLWMCLNICLFFVRNGGWLL